MSQLQQILPQNLSIILKTKQETSKRHNFFEYESRGHTTALSSRSVSMCLEYTNSKTHS